MTVMAGAIIAPALPDIGNAFPHVSQTYIKLLLTMPAVMISIFAGLIGTLSDRFGRKRLLLFSLALYGVSGSSGYFLNDYYLLLASRAGLGVGVAGIMGLSTTLIGDYFSGSERNNFAGAQASVMSIGGVVFLTVGGIIADQHWRMPFLMYTMAFLVFPLAYLWLYEPEREPLSQTEEEGGEVDFFKIGLIYFMGLFTMTAFYMIPTQIPFLMEKELSISSTLIGMAIAVTTLAGAVSSLLFGRIKSKMRYLSIFILALAMSAFGFFGVGAYPQYSTIVMSLGLAGLGFGLVMPNCNLWLMELSSIRIRGRIIGGFTAVMFSGQFISPLVADIFVEKFGFGATFISVSVIMVVLIFCLVILRVWYNKRH